MQGEKGGGLPWCFAGAFGFKYKGVSYAERGV
jgi:hypothetical protein